MNPPLSQTLSPAHRGYVTGTWGQMHYREVGEGDPLLLIHQVPWSSAQYHKAMAPLAAAGLRAIALDSPGYGMSDPPPEPMTVEAYADNLARVLDGLGVPRTAISGHHAGALMATGFAARHPDRVTRLVIDNAPMWTAQERLDRQGMAGSEMALKPDGSHFTDRWNRVRTKGDPEWSDESVQLAVLSFYNNGPYAEYAYWAAFRYDIQAGLAAIRCPTLLLAGRTDLTFASAAKIRAARPDFAYAELDGGVAMQLERPEQWAAPIIAFLKGAADE